jgi:hypothetical protein
MAKVDLRNDPRKASPTSTNSFLRICEIMIKYKGYIGHFNFEETKNMFCGKVAITPSSFFRENL